MTVERRLGAPSSINQNDLIRLSDPLVTVDPIIDGDNAVDGVLTVTDPVLRDGAVTDTLEYQWYRGGVLIDGETANTYTVVTADIDQRLRCLVWVTYAGIKKKWFSNALIGEA